MTAGRYGCAGREPAIEYNMNGFDIDFDPDAEEESKSLNVVIACHKETAHAKK